MRPSKSLLLVAGITAATIALAAGCAESSINVGSPLDAAAPPPFFSDLDSGDGSEAGPPAPLALCIATECLPPYASCGSSYRCSTNLSNDPENCGACGRVCPTDFGYLNLTSSCVNGTCEPACAPKLVSGKTYSFANCNGEIEDGCEVSISTDPNNCGVCGNECAPGVGCIDGRCGCGLGQRECDGACIDVRFDDKNCGACGVVCGTPEDAGAPPPNTYSAASKVSAVSPNASPCSASSAGPTVTET